MSVFRDAWRDEFFAALTFLTRLPLGRAPAEAPLLSLADTSWAFPVVGVAIGAIGGIAYMIASALALPALAAALIAVTATALVTGALHEDGLADTVDGFGGGASREAKLEIMRDSRIGTFGVLALIVSIGLRAVAIADIGTRWHVFLALIAAHALARGVLPWMAMSVPYARKDGLAANAGRPDAGIAAIAAVVAVAIALLVLPWISALGAALLAGLSGLGMARLAQRQIGGQTGDVLGAFEQIGEIVVLLVAAANIGG